MPQLLAVPALATAGGTGTAAATGGGLLAGVTTTQLVTAGVVVTAALATGYGITVINDYLDEAATASEVDGIKAQAGERSKADRRALENCANCVWCQINIQAQGNFLQQSDRTLPQGIGPYLVQGRTVFAREGVIIAGLTHEFAKGVARSRDFKNITSWRILERTVSYIQSRPPGGLPPGEHRPGSLERYSSDVRYDIMVTGTIFAFMA